MDAQTTQAQEELDAILKQQREALQSINLLKLEQEGVEAGKQRVSQELATVQGNLEATKSKLGDMITETVKKETVFNALTDAIAQAETTLERVKRETDIAKTAYLDELEQARRANDVAINNAQDELKTLISAKEEAEDGGKAILESVETKRQELKSLVEGVNNARASITDMEYTIAQREETVGALNAKIAQLEDTVSQLESSIASEREKRDALMAESQQKQADISVLEAQAISIQKEIDTNSLTNADLLKARAGVMEKDLFLSQKIEMLKLKYGELGEPW
jgi:chromosome segregation ATPase